MQVIFLWEISTKFGKNKNRNFSDIIYKNVQLHGDRSSFRFLNVFSLRLDMIIGAYLFSGNQFKKEHLGM